MIEERKRTRIIAKEIKLQNQAEKALRKIANNTSKPHKKGSNFKGKSKAIDTSVLSQDEEVIKQSDDELSLMEMAAATPARSRRNRNINLP
jgi:hypothetical protein